MCRTAAKVFSLVLVMVVAVNEYGVASLTTSTTLCGLTQEELVMSVIVNQMAILKNMNESSCVCASRDNELREIRLLKEEVKSELEAIKEVKGELEAMKKEVESKLTAVKMLESVQNSSIITPSQQPDPPALDTLHNDTDPSLCGANKVLYGSRGSLSPSHPSNYNDLMNCEWHVILPEGTRPVFRWEYVQIESESDCSFDSVRVWAPRLWKRVNITPICGSEAPSQHPMYNITENEFVITFTSDFDGNFRGFLLHYQAEINEISA